MTSETVTWVKDADNRHEVSSAAHLVQIMNKGTVDLDAGDAPSSSGYWASSATYVQTADIDLAGVHANIRPIGNDTDTFQGLYDGGNFKISNWSYGNSDNTELYTGLFGYCQYGTLQNIRLAGVWTLGGFGSYGGFLCGYLKASSFNAAAIYDCEGDFDTGTTLGAGLGYGSAPMVGGSILGTIRGLTVRGIIQLAPSSKPRGGVIGSASDGVVSQVRNVATFTSGIVSSDSAGGIIGYIGSKLQPSDFLNAMIGNISAPKAGGIIGNARYSQGYPRFDTFVNAMTGNISASSGARYAGGIFGAVNALTWAPQMWFSKMVNYMSGDITGTRSGGLIGYFESSATGDVAYGLDNSIVAMNGTVTDAVISYAQTPLVTVDVVVNTDFGMSFTSNVYTPATSVGEGFIEHPVFNKLPYIGNDHDWDFVYSNLAGNTKYANYTHASIHTGIVSSPFFADFGAVEASFYGRHLTFANATTGELFTDGSITVVATDATTILEYSITYLDARGGPINIVVDVLPVEGAVALKLTYQASAGVEETAFAGFTSGQKHVKSLEPETEYTLRLYSDSGAGYVLKETITVPTLSNDPENYNLDDFTEDGKIKIHGLRSEARERVSRVMNELFATGDEVEVLIRPNRYAHAKFLNRGGTHRIRDADALLIPFDADSGSAQMVNLQKEDDSVVAVTYDESENTIDVQSVVYTPGDTFIIDGIKCTVVEY